MARNSTSHDDNPFKDFTTGRGSRPMRPKFPFGKHLVAIRSLTAARARPVLVIDADLVTSDTLPAGAGPHVAFIDWERMPLGPGDLYKFLTTLAAAANEEVGRNGGWGKFFADAVGEAQPHRGRCLRLHVYPRPRSGYPVHEWSRP